MSYVKKTLMSSSGERVLALGRFHWIYMFKAFLWLIFTFWYGYGFYKFAKMAIRRYTTEIAVTNMRFIYKHGWIQRHTQEFTLERIESVDFEQSIVGRLLGYGTIVVKGTGTGEVRELPELSRPVSFRKAILAARAEGIKGSFN